MNSHLRFVSRALPDYNNTTNSTFSPLPYSDSDAAPCVLDNSTNSASPPIAYSNYTGYNGNSGYGQDYRDTTPLGTNVLIVIFVVGGFFGLLLTYGCVSFAAAAKVEAGVSFHSHHALMVRSFCAARPEF
jgi:hypothetical protein